MDGRYLEILRRADRVTQAEIAAACDPPVKRVELSYVEQSLSANDDWVEKYATALRRVLDARRKRRVGNFEKLRLKIEEDAAARAAKQAAKKGKE